ncbi:MAG: AAA family ATPase [Flavobacteriales bacterium]|nr:AAA family ATPase [Flavobacteriales bacterium]
MISERPYIKTVEFDRPESLSNSHPFNIPLVHNLKEIDFHKDVTFFVGENGAGKSTLIEAIAVGLGFSKEGGNKNFNIETTGAAVSELHQHLKFIKSFKKPQDYYFLRAESFFNVATYMDEVNYLSSYGGKSLHEQSHGESFLSLLNHKLKGNGLYIFDEPEAALSPLRQLTAVTAIHQLVQKNSQFIIATHSPIIMAYPNAKILMIENGNLVETRFEDTEHFQVYQLFFQNHEIMIKEAMKSPT